MSIEIIHNKHNDYCRQYYQTHKKERAEYHHNHYESNKNYILLRNKLYRLEHKEDISLNKKKYYEEHQLERAEYCRTHTDYTKAKQIEYRLNGKSRMATREYRLNHPEKIIAYRLKIKKEVLTHYGLGKCACAKCGFDDIRALSIDHINGDGYKDRKKKVGVFCYNWLISNNYPEGYQTLCMNCQFIKKVEHNENKWRENRKVREINHADRDN